MGVVKVSIWNVTWRDGRPRFAPGPKLRRRVGRGYDLRHDPMRQPCPCAILGAACPVNGDWFTLDETERWTFAKKAEILQAKVEGKRIAPVKRHRGLSVSDLFEEWYRAPKFNGGVNVGKRKEKGLADSTVENYKRTAKFLCRFDPELAQSPPAAISDEVAQGVFETLWEKHGLSSARQVVATASSCWTWAGGVGRAGLRKGFNPWKNVEKSLPDPRVVVLEDFEITAWIAACDLPMPSWAERPHAKPPKHPGRAPLVARPELGDAIMLGLFTGQRPSDRLTLQNKSRDEKGRRIFRQSKTGAIVAIPEAPQLAARLVLSEGRRKTLGVVDPHVVMDERRRRKFAYGHYMHLLAARRQLAIDGVIDEVATAAAREEHMRLRLNSPPPTIWKLAPCPSLAGKQDRDLRDTAVTWLARAGCNVMQIASITGHSLASIHGVLKHYLALHPEMADAAIGMLVKWMDENGVKV